MDVTNMAKDSNHENNPNMQRYALLAIIHIYTMLCLAFGIGHFVNVNFFETLQLNLHIGAHLDFLQNLCKFW